MNKADQLWYDLLIKLTEKIRTHINIGYEEQNEQELIKAGALYEFLLNDLLDGDDEYPLPDPDREKDLSDFPYEIKSELKQLGIYLSYKGNKGNKENK